MSLDGKIALVTGATSGIGLATARRFLDEGARTLIVTGADAERLEAARRDLGTDARVVAVRWRAEEAGDLAALVEAVREAGGLDILFANAGVTWPAPLGQIEAEAAQRQFMVNFTGPVLLIQALAAHLHPGASVVLNASALDTKGMAGMTIYSATKAALRSAARTLSTELTPRSVRVNVVSPGPIETPLYGKIGLDGDSLAGMKAGLTSSVPAGRFGRADEVAGVVAFLASDASSYVLGAEINADGGFATL